MLGRLTWTILKIVSYLVIKGHQRLMAFTNLIVISGLDYKRNGVEEKCLEAVDVFPFCHVIGNSFVEEKTFEDSFKRKNVKEK